MKKTTGTSDVDNKTDKKKADRKTAKHIYRDKKM